MSQVLHINSNGRCIDGVTSALDLPRSPVNALREWVRTEQANLPRVIRDEIAYRLPQNPLNVYARAGTVNAEHVRKAGRVWSAACLRLRLRDTHWLPMHTQRLARAVSEYIPVHFYAHDLWHAGRIQHDEHLTPITADNWRAACASWPSLRRDNLLSQTMDVVWQDFESAIPESVFIGSIRWLIDHAYVESDGTYTGKPLRSQLKYTRNRDNDALLWHNPYARNSVQNAVLAALDTWLEKRLVWLWDAVLAEEWDTVAPGVTLNQEGSVYWLFWNSSPLVAPNHLLWWFGILGMYVAQTHRTPPFFIDKMDWRAYLKAVIIRMTRLDPFYIEGASIGRYVLQTLRVPEHAQIKVLEEGYTRMVPGNNEWKQTLLRIIASWYAARGMQTHLAPPHPFWVKWWQAGHSE